MNQRSINETNSEANGKQFEKSSGFCASEKLTLLTYGLESYWKRLKEEYLNNMDKAQMKI